MMFAAVLHVLDQTAAFVPAILTAVEIMCEVQTIMPTS